MGQVRTKSEAAATNRYRITAILSAILVLMAAHAQPQTAPKAAAAAKAVATEEENSAPVDKPGAQGLKVHGHWVLQVKNADGTLGERREFDNSLITNYAAGLGAGTSQGPRKVSTSGAAILAAALSGNLATSDPAIGFIYIPANQPAALTGPPESWCSFTPGAGYNTFCYVFTTANSLWNFTPVIGTAGDIGPTTGLTAASNMDIASGTGLDNPGGTSIVLSGNFSVPNGVPAITAVQSLWGGCVSATASYATKTLSPGGGSVWVLNNPASFGNADIAPKNCVVSSSLLVNGTEAPILGTLTSTTLPTPLTVTSGQIIAVSVTISFS